MIRLYGLLNSWLTTLHNEQGQGLVEYALIMLLIVIVLIASLVSLGGVLQTTYYEPLANSFPGG